MMPAGFHAAALYTLAAFFSCTAQPSPVVRFQFVDAPPAFSQARTTYQLRALAPTATGANLAAFPVTTGLTQGRIEAQTSVQFRSQRILSGDYCLWPQEVDVKVRYRAQVYIAKQYPVSSCRYRVTKTHELRHVAADEDALKDDLPAVRQAVEARARQAFPDGPFTLAQRDGAQGLEMKSMENAVSGALEKLDRDRERRQRAIDTPAEYMRLSRACPGEPIQ